MLGSTSLPTTLAAVTMMVMGAACGADASAPTARTLPAADPEPEPTSPVATPVANRGDEPSEDGLEVSPVRGSVDPSVVSDRLEPRAPALEACYSTQVGRRKWLGGGLELAWDVGGDGTIAGVRIASSDLGAWPIEKCVLGVARAVSFGAPRGNKPAMVTAPLTFSAGVGAVRWNDAMATKAIGDKLAKLATCASTSAAPTDVTITLYLGTRGKVQTVGFASPRGFAEAWADCAEKMIMAWSLTDPRGKVAKLSINYNPSGADADADDRDR